MAFASSSVAVKIQLQDSSRNLEYVGDPNNALYIWGAQLEFGEYFEDLRFDIDNVRYIRTRGVESQAFNYRFGQDQTPDYIVSDERIFKSVRMVAHSAGTFLNTQIERIDNTSGNAALVQEVFIPRTWYRLAPLYSSYINIFNNPNQRGDTITVGELDETLLDVVEDYQNLSGTLDFDSTSGTEDYRYLPT